MSGEAVVMDGHALISRFHAQPGRTVTMLEPWHDALGRSSYEVLASAVRAAPRRAAVLDLGCGDGHLLAMLARDGFERLVGVDVSPHELAAARARLGPRVELYCEDAHALSLPSHTFDAVTCHMALMLMSSAEAALGEIARVLAPAGSLLAIINRGLHDPVMEVHRRELRRMTAELGMEPFECGDRRVFSVGGLHELLRGPAWAHEHLRIEDLSLAVTTTPSRLWDTLRLMYDVFRLPAQAQAELQARLLRAWAPLTSADGRLTCRMGMRRLECRTRASTRN